MKTVAFFLAGGNLGDPPVAWSPAEDVTLVGAQMQAPATDVAIATFPELDVFNFINPGVFDQLIALFSPSGSATAPAMVLSHVVRKGESVFISADAQCCVNLTYETAAE